MGVDTRHYVLVGVDIGYENECKIWQLPYVQQFKFDENDVIDPDDNDPENIDRIELDNDLKNKGLVYLTDYYSNRYCYIGAVLMSTGNSRWEVACFDGIELITGERIEEAKNKLLNSPFASIIDPEKIGLYVGSHCS
jgi:hypothetical protein